MKRELKKKQPNNKLATPAPSAIYSYADYNESVVAQFKQKDVDPFPVRLLFI